MRRIGVTGANGFIGSLLIERLHNLGYEVVSFLKPNDNFNRFNVEKYSQEIYEIDFLKQNNNEAFSKLNIDVLIHLAWGGVNGIEKGKIETQLNNVEMAKNVSKFAFDVGAKRLICLGTITECAYETLNDDDKNDVLTLSPSLLYAKYKLIAKDEMYSFCQKNSIEFSWIRLSNLYGENNNTGNILSYEINELLKGNSPSFGRCDQYYDFLYVNDAVDAIIKIASCERALDSLYFVGSSKPRILKEFIAFVAKAMNREHKIIFGDRPSDGLKFEKEWFDNSKTINLIGTFENGTFEDNIRKVIDNTQRMKRAIITGVAGFVGNAVAKTLIDNGIEVLGVDIADGLSKERNIVSPLFKYIRTDIKNLFNEDIDFGKYDVFYHFAWDGSAGPKRNDYLLQINNAVTTVSLIENAAKNRINYFVCAGTIMEYEVYSAIYSQGTKPQMGYIYGVGKMLAHLLAKPIANDCHINLVWANITNAYGVGEYSPRLINSTIRKCIDNEQLEFTSGTQNYDFVYIDDVARAFYLLGEKGKPNKNYVIGSGEAMRLKEYLLKLIACCNPDVKPIFGNVKFTGVDLPIDVFSINEIRNDCFFEPQVTFEDGIKKTMEWIKNNEGD